MIKLFELVKEQRKIEQKKIDQENITRIQAALPKQFKFQIVQHISDKQRFIGRFGDDYYALFFPEPRDLVDKDFVSLDERLISMEVPLNTSAITQHLTLLYQEKELFVWLKS